LSKLPEGILSPVKWLFTFFGMAKMVSDKIAYNVYSKQASSNTKCERKKRKKGES
jgi:hypothetical protein